MMMLMGLIMKKERKNILNSYNILTKLWIIKNQRNNIQQTLKKQYQTQQKQAVYILGFQFGSIHKQNDQIPISKSVTLQQVEKMQQSADRVDKFSKYNNFNVSLTLNQLETKKQKVIYARWFDKKVVTSQIQNALIQYITHDYATIAKESLNDIMFYGQSIKNFFSNYDEISLKIQPIKKFSFKISHLSKSSNTITIFGHAQFFQH